MAGDFDSIKIGVCDCYYTPVGSNVEMFLGLTKGGVEVTYTPEFKDIQVDQYGNTPVDSILIGESIVAKVPLAETDLNKLAQFAPTATKVYESGQLKRITFGSKPGKRLAETAGKLRLHPVAMGDDKSQDIIIYRAANKGNMQMNFKMDEEQIFNCEFTGMIVRGNNNGAMLFEIGNPSVAPGVLTLSPNWSNLDVFYELYGTSAPIISFDATKLVTDGTTSEVINVSVSVNDGTGIDTYIVNPVQSGKSNPLPKFEIVATKVGTYDLLDGSNNFVTAVTISADGAVVAKDDAVLKTYKYNGISVDDGDVITTTVRITYGGKSKDLTFDTIVETTA